MLLKQLQIRHIYSTEQIFVDLETQFGTVQQTSGYDKC